MPARATKVALTQRGVSGQGLEKVLKATKSGPPVCTTRNGAANASSKAFEELKHEEVILLDDGAEFVWKLLHPNKLLRKIVSADPYLQTCFAECAAQKTTEFWKLVVAFDEYVPGSKFMIDTNRKSMNLSFMFCDLGARALSLENIWITPVTIATKTLAKIPGGWSQVLRRYLKLQLIGDQGLQTAGVALELNGSIYLLKAKLHALLTDGDGHRSALQWRGAAGLLPCFRHGNVLKLNSNLAHRRIGYYEIDHEHANSFVTNSSQRLYDDVDAILEGQRLWRLGELPQARLTEMGMASGLNVTEDGLLADRLIRALFNPIDCMRYDWVHSCLQDGVMSKALTLFRGACMEKANLKASDLEAYLSGKEWCFCKQGAMKSKQLHRIFSEYRRSGTDADFGVKANPSEMLGLYGLIRHWAETRVLPIDLEEEREYYLSACKIVDVCLMAKRQVITCEQAGPMLRACVGDYLVRHKTLWGTAFFTPKVHWMFDIAEQMLLGDDGLLLDALVIERIHLRVKCFAEHVKNTRCFEQSVLRKVLEDQLSCSVAQHTPLRGAITEHTPTLFSSRALVCGTMRVECGDIVFENDMCGEVVRCICEAGTLNVIVDVLPRIREVSAHSVQVDTIDVVKDCCWLAGSISLAVAWY